MHECDQFDPLFTLDAVGFSRCNRCMSSNSYEIATASERPLLSNLKEATAAVLICGAITGAALGLHRIPYVSVISPVIMAVAIGMLLNGFSTRYKVSHRGLAFVSRPLLRFAIVLLGFQLSWGQIYDMGLLAAVVVVVSLSATMVSTIALGSLLGVSRSLTQLIAAGTSICGASAIAATNAASRGSDEEVAYALACVTLCGTVAMFVCPALMPVLQLDQYQYGVWVGSSVHEVAQVVGAAFQGGDRAGEYGTVAKLMRVALLAPVVMALGCIGNGAIPAQAGWLRRLSLPPFILAFLAVVSLNSLVAVPADVKSVITTAAMLCLTMALAAIGLATDIHKLGERGLRPLFLAFCASLVIAGVSLCLVKLSL